ncbi:ISAs1 family transposase [Singulisphaera acidiphila]|uniref:Transposase n=1 Tax=Singulisphaera acidiphila (strain ATCC BAA-1392 / DSM 18658 / VKM B-2454 / MOB10) TaxID=886293 RepID=L0DHS2_SINAD|nr:ISAs1 family transposase [Singulisphaera acidiphila]AGA28358.1 transposase [Singulisphaera acidiphila DSM 18658]
MANDLSTRIEDHFASLTDPRRRKVVYPLISILTIALCAVIAGADDFATIAAWGRQKRAWLAKILDPTNGIPPHDRFNAIFRAIKPAEFERCPLSWITSLHEVTAGQVVAIDGKTLRQRFDKANAKSAIPMVSAWATTNHISLGQIVVDAKSNEITAIPKLLELLDVSGCLVTIDAMGCQTEIAEKIVQGGADYVLAVKGNQPTLFEGIMNFFVGHMDDDFARVKVSRHETKDKGHGRIEHRTYYVCDVPEELPGQARWKGLKQIGVAISDTMRGDKPCDDVRYNILCKKLSAKSFGAAVRSYWKIENSLCWQLDMSFGEDRSRIRNGQADANFAIVRTMALSLLKHERSHKSGVKSKRLTAGWNDDYLEQVLFGS